VITVNLTFANQQELVAFFTQQGQALTAVKEAAPKAPKQPKAEKPAPSAEPAKAPSGDSGPEAGTVTETTASPSEPAPTAPEQVKVTLEFVRGKLADLSRAGKADQVEALLGEMGVDRLTSLDPARYTELLNKAAAL
jgi:hypothetical protein